jgi:glycine betaine transporter
MNSKMNNRVFETKNMEWPTFIISAGFFILFISLCLINEESARKLIYTANSIVVNYFGAVMQFVFLAIWLTCLLIAFSKYGDVKIGGKDAKIDIKTYNWFAIILTTLLAGGGVFFSAAEPMYHFLTVPKAFGAIAAGTEEAIGPAMAQSFLHWGFLAWGAQAIGVMILIYACDFKGMPLKARTLLYPVLGEKGVLGVPGTLMDACSLIAVAAGTIGPIGFLSLQMSYALQAIWGVPDAFTSRLVVLVITTAVFTLAASTGIYKGIDFLAKWTIHLAIFIIGFVLIFGPGIFILDSFMTGMGTYVSNFFKISLYRGDTEWLGSWTAFYWPWFLSYGPTMAILLVRISKGRTLRQLLLVVCLVGPVITNFWFSILGGAGIFMELTSPGSIAGPLSAHGMPTVLLTIMQNMPFATLLVPLSLLLVALFLVTTGAGVVYSMAIGVTGMELPYRWVRVLWGVILGTVATLLVKIGGERVMNALQTFIVVAAVPLFIFYIPQLYGAYDCAKKYWLNVKGQQAEEEDEVPVATQTPHGAGSV